MASQVRVGVRVRPLTAREVGEGGKSVILAVPPEIRLGERRFTYDNVFDATLGQADLYAQVSGPLLRSFLEGYNATCICYGQTGSGKTYTMGSEAHTELEMTENTGLIPRFMNDLFVNLQTPNYQLEASFLEVYGEDVHDLLDPARPSLPLREDANGGVICAGLKQYKVTSATEALKVLHEGTLNRTTAATLMNLTSSRSHAVFSVTLTQKQTSEDGSSLTVSSRFTFVDLAGSERMKKTGAEGERAREGIKINEGLLALGNVINALADEERLTEGKKIHVPYRQSKLTRLLQDALGGNSQTLFLACVSPSDTNASETLSTLHYANRARNIKNAPTKNVDANALEMQRLRSLNQVLEAELIKLKFGASEETSAEIGVADDQLLQRRDVSEYLSLLQQKAEERQDKSAPRMQLVPSRSLPMLSSPTNVAAATHLPTAGDPNKSIMDNYDPSLLTEVNPDEEMAILDQLLELQHRDNEYDQEQKKDHEQLKQVEGELAEQQTLLLQLRESLKVYHEMKGKYELLVAEVQQLEAEKAELAEQLERSVQDPSKGCSKAIKKELEKVEQSLARARNETRAHREKYRKAEQEAKKCAVLERKIVDLKAGRANLIKKQKEAAARHREYTETKTREILALKRKDRKNEQRMSKLQTEIHVQKRNLDKRQEYCSKLSAKLKQTEEHLMKLLSMRQRELRERSTAGGRETGRRMSVLTGKVTASESQPDFAPRSDSLDSFKYLLDQVMMEMVSVEELKNQYEERVAEYGQAMRSMVNAVKSLEESRRQSESKMSDDDDDGAIREQEQYVEELELKVELVGSELESLRSQLSMVEDAENLKPEATAEKLLKDKNAPVLRTVLLEMIEHAADLHLQRNGLKRNVTRKESALRAMEQEVESLSTQVDTLTRDIQQRKCAAAEPTNIIDTLEQSNKAATEGLAKAKSELEALKSETKSLSAAKHDAEVALSELKERYALLVAGKKQHESATGASEELLQKLQVIWREVGVAPQSRDEVREQIENCLDDTCARKLIEASELKAQTLREIDSVSQELQEMTECLGIDTGTIGDSSMECPLLEKLTALRKRHSQLQPTFANATARAESIRKQVSKLSAVLGLTIDDLPDCLQAVCDKTRAGNLCDDFLSKCDREVSRLRIKKSEVLVSNAELQKKTFALVSEMNLEDEQILPLVIHSLKRRLGSMPEWWSDQSAQAATRSVTVNDGVVRVSLAFSKHISAIHESLESLSKGRRHLSETLKSLVERAQQTLLETVEGEIDASEAYASFHQALFKLPPLSKGRIDACVTEIKALSAGVEDMTQSEIEALTVVWEALDVSMSERGKLWGEIEDAVGGIQTQPAGPFDNVIHACSSDGEEWVLAVVKQTTKTYRDLEARLFKLDRIHKEVEKLRARQDAKSKIISLDSEIRILSSKLSEFEDKQCNKQRLLSRNVGSAHLLKEERFRKQMQQKYTSKLEQLAKHLKEWSEVEDIDFDPNLLSDEVRLLLQNSSNMDSWVEKRTEFMHLRTVQTKAKKRSADGMDDASGQPLPKRQARATSEAMASSKAPVAPSASKKVFSRAQPSPVAKRKTVAKHASPAKAPKMPPAASKASKRKPLSPEHNSQPAKKRATPSKRLTLPPFGRVLEQAATPAKRNENES